MTLGEALEESVQTLVRAAVDDARLDARLLAAFALKRTPERIFGYPEDILNAAELGRLRALIARRAAREPLAMITGEKEFWSLRFAVGAATLIPRPDSETLVEAVLRSHPDKAAGLRILDLGTGTGCLLLALLHEYGNARGIGVERDGGALQLARANAGSLGLAERAEFILADWNEGIPGLPEFDVVVCNPPYIATGDKQSLPPEVALFEPGGALFAGPDGLSEFRAVIKLLPALLKPGGGVFFEVGAGQDEAVAAMLMESGMSGVGVYPDLAAVGRCVTATLF